MKKWKPALEHLTTSLLENLLDPGKVLYYVCVHVGNIWIATGPIHVERHDTNRLPVAHQGASRITL